MDGLRGLHAFLVYVYSPSQDGLGRRPARLEQTRCPEPLVYPHLLHEDMVAGAIVGVVGDPLLARTHPGLERK
jgi:hypothetical protein